MIQRLRWVMLGVMFFSMCATLAGQSAAFWQAGFWHGSSEAMRFDGLSIYSHTNPMFTFFLGHGWLPYVLACLVYFALAFGLVSVLPKKPALVAIFAFIFGHFHGGSNWLVVHWQVGIQGFIVYGIAVGIALTVALVPVSSDRQFAVQRLAWIAAGTLVLDFTNTLIGQPHAYWQNPANVHEANALSRYFLLHGWWAFCMYDVVYCCVILLLPVLLPRGAAMIGVFAFMLGGYAGASNWFFYVWRMGMETPVLLGIALSAMIAWLVFPSPETSQTVPRMIGSVGG